MINSDIKVLPENATNTYGILVEHDGYIAPSNQSLHEDVQREIEDDGSYIVYATLQKADTPNRNGRIYPKDILERENQRYQQVIKDNASFHQLDHPDDSVVELKGGSPHRVLETWWDGKYLFGKLEILTSPGYRKYGIASVHGDIMAMYLFEYNMTLGVSSRGIGSLKEEGKYNKVQNDFELICWDVVSSPSTPGSYIYKEKEAYKTYDKEPEDLDDIDTSGTEVKDEYIKKLQQTFFSK